jgi:cytochrome c oxidase subunit IV
MSHSTPHHFDEANPHGEHHHSHPIIPPITLTTVLAFLLLFTVLTVGLAQLEVWAQGYFDIVLPRWVNIAVAMPIAVVKAVLVMAIFMQLRYDNFMNTVVMLFTFFAVGLFIFFSGLDLFTRDRVTPYKAQYVVPGGTGVGTDANKPIVQSARDKYKQLWASQPGRFEALEAESKHGKHGHAKHETGSSASQSRGGHGLSGALSTSPASDPHGAHSEKSAH